MSLKLDIALVRKNFSLNINAEIANQGITAVYGSSGSGKTTLLRSIAGLEKNVTGRIFFNDEIWLNENKKLAVEKRRVGFVFQHACLFPHLNVRQNINFGLHRSASKNQNYSFDEITEILGLTSLLDQNSQSLSGGEKQRVAIARAILSHPRILLMDEPLGSLDNKRKQDILPYLEKIHQELGLPILYVSHSEDEIAQLADHVIVMSAGKITEQGKLHDILNDLNSPFAQLDNCFSVIDCKIKSIQQEFKLAHAQFEEFELRLPSQQLKLEQNIRVRVLAKDVSLSLELSKNSSILNSLKAKICEIKSDSNAQCLIRLSVGNTYLISRISDYSKQKLNLAIGMKVYAQIKAVALIK